MIWPFENDTSFVIKKLADRSFRANKMRNVIAIIAIALTAILFTSLFTLGIGVKESTRQANMILSGGDGHAKLIHMDEAEYETISGHPLVKEIAYCRKLADSVDNEALLKRLTLFEYYDEIGLKYLSIEPTSGHMPIEENEVITDTATLDLLDVPHEIGEEITLTLTVHNQQITRSFVLAGWWESYPGVNYGTIAASKAYVQAHTAELTDTYDQDHVETGTITALVKFENDDNIENDLETVLKESGYSSDVSSASYINAAASPLYTSSESSTDRGTNSALACALLAFLLSGYLIIYNIFQISVIRDIRFYGLLKTIGTTGKQIRAIIRRQALFLSCMGIPLGLGLGWLTGCALVPLMMKQTFGGTMDVQIKADPKIFAGSILFALLTVFISTARPGRIAAKVSPVEAVRYTDVSCRTKMKKRKSSRTNVIRMARANLGRNKKKTFLVVISLSLAVVLLQATYTFALGFDMDKFLEKWVVSDFILGDADYFQYHYQGSGEALPQEDIAAVEAEGGITESGRIYANRLGVMEYVTEDLYREYFRGTDPEMIEEMLAKEERDADGKVKINAAFYGMEEYPLSQLNVFEGDIADLYDPEKNAIAAVYMEDDYGAVIEGSQWAKVGDTVKVRYVYEWEYSDAKTGEIIPKEQVDVYEGEVIAKEKEYQDVSYKVAACVTVKQAMGYRFYGDHQFVLNAQVYQRDRKSADVMSYLFNTEKENLSSMQSFLQNYTEHVNPVLDFESKSRYIEAFDGYRTMFLIVGTGLSFIIGLIGILNFFNAILTSISVRRREFAMLQSIGMTGKQLKRMLICEGLLYGIFAVACSAVLCAAFGYLIKAVVSGMFWFFTYRFTLLPVIVVIPVFAAFGILLPLFCYRSVAKQTIVERLRLGD